MEWMEPMEPILKDSVITEKGWIHQVKWDGIRGLCYVDHINIRLYTRSGRERISNYPEISVIGKQLHCKQAVLDGELIVMDNRGKPSFYMIMSRERVKRQDRLSFYFQKYPVQYMVFDILYKDGSDLRGLTLNNRRRILDKVLTDSPIIQAIPDYSDGEVLFSMMRDKGMEGIVSKYENSTYTAGKKHRDWYKTKIFRKLLTVVCGVKMKEGSVKSLILGIYREEKLFPVGSVSSGLSCKDRLILKETLPKLQQSFSPFYIKTALKDAIWFKPVLTAQIKFMEWEPAGGLRHPVLIGFSSQSPSEAIGEEEPL